jgi:hypothetical protein
MLYTMPEHRIAHLAQSLFPKMQPIIKDSTHFIFVSNTKLPNKKD